LELDEGERRELTSLASRRSTAQGLAQRARIILACADGEQSKVVAARLGIDPDTVGKCGDASPRIGLKVFGMSRDRGRRARSRMPGSRR
jgi:FixJ family two-component response regulator